MSIKNLVNDWMHACMTRRVMRAYNRKSRRVEKKHPELFRPVGDALSRQHRELWDERTIHPRIEHLGYKSPTEIQEYVKDAGCFVLPSVYEPWGVVVHEAALMSLPMLCSNQVQAATKFLREGENGYVFDPADETEMSETFVRIMKQDDRSLRKLGEKSFDLGMSYTLGDWAKVVREQFE